MNPTLGRTLQQEPRHTQFITDDIRQENSRPFFNGTSDIRSFLLWLVLFAFYIFLDVKITRLTS